MSFFRDNYLDIHRPRRLLKQQVIKLQNDNKYD